MAKKKLTAAQRARETAKKKKEQEKLKKEKVKAKLEKQKAARKRAMLEKYVKIVQQTNMFPTRSDLATVGISRDNLRHYFVNIKGMRDAAKMTFPEVFEGVVDVENYIDKKYQEALQKEIKKYKRFFITTAVNGQFVHPGFMESINTYCKKNKTKLLILPCHDPAHNLDNQIEWHFDDVISQNGHDIVFSELSLNSNIHISGLRVTAKQINPTTGLARVSQNKGSFIFGSPKQPLEFNPVASKKMPHALMGTGACTVKNYKTTKGNSLRSAFLADHDHELGGLIVEIEDDKIYHFRQIQIDVKGKFIDLGIEYSGKSTKAVRGTRLVLGDYHAGEHEESAVNAWEQIINQLKVEELFLHDVHNGLSTNHHEEKNMILRAKRAQEVNQISLEAELKITAREIDRMASLESVKKVVIIKSNHDEFLNRWLNECRFKNDPINFQLGCRLADKSIDGADPLQEGIKEVGGLKHSRKVLWLKRDQDYKFADIELGAHGDVGPNGARGSKANLEKAYGKCVIGHSHTPGILRGVFQVGTTSKFQLGYNRGASSWMHTSCLVYPNGQRQLINSIGGKWRLK